VLKLRDLGNVGRFGASLCVCVCVCVMEPDLRHGTAEKALSRQSDLPPTCKN